MMANGDTLNGIFEQDPHALPDGRIINAAHFQPGLSICPIYTDDPSGIRGWIRSAYTEKSPGGTISREIEPSWFMRSDDVLVMTFRDQNGTFKRLACVSSDQGESWTTPVLTDMPDSRSKQSNGNLPNGTAFMVGNPVNNKTRIPLAVTLSKDGAFFNTAYLLRQGDTIPALRYTGTAKRLGYHYPKSMIYQGFLYVSYATNKEDVEFTKVRLTRLMLDTTTMSSVYLASSTKVPDGFTLHQNYPNPFNPATTIKYSLNKSVFVTLSLFDVNGREIGLLVNEEKQAGSYQVVVNNQNLASGLYYFRLQVNGRNETKKMMVLK